MALQPLRFVAGLTLPGHQRVSGTEAQGLPLVSRPVPPPRGWQAAPRLSPEPSPESLLALWLDSRAVGVTTAGLFRTWSVAGMGFCGFLEPW